MSNLYHGRPRQYVEDHPDAEIYPVKCVPNNRPKGSWTNGVPAWTKPTTTKSSELVGWFAPPRLRNKGWKNRAGSKSRVAIQEEE